jgi:putative membrane protein
MTNWLYLLLYWIVSGAALALTAALTPGFRIRGFSTAMIAVLLIGAANYFIRPVLLFLTFPLTILTLGFFVFVVDAIILRICSAFLDDFEITNWFSAVIGAVILALTSSLLHFVLI